MTSLEALVLGPSFFSGTLPTEFGQLTELRVLDMNTNGPITGPIPTELGLLTQLQVLNLSNNAFDNKIPTELGRITTLVEVQLGLNSLTGSMPAEICAIAADPALQLEVLVVDCGSDPPEVSCEIPACCSECAPVG